MKKFILFYFIVFLFFEGFSQQAKYPFQNPELSVEDRITDLLARMSLEEKVRQMDMYKGGDFKEEENFSGSKTYATIGKLGVGAIHDIYPESAKMINDLQKYVIENNRWGIPALIMCEMLHGYTGEGGTAFPMNIGLGSTWDKELMKKVGQVIGTEGRAHGVHYGLGPVLGIGREPRWGRVAETFSEDTYLAGEIGLAMIIGIQGDTLDSNRAMISEPKHFAVHSVPQTGSNSSPILVGERTSREDFLPVFEKAFVEGGALGTMCAYTELDGIPCAANHWLLTEVLRNEWGFKGIVISDLGAIRYIQTTHFAADSPQDAIRQAVSAGVDMQFYDFKYEFWQKTIIDLVREGKLPMKDIDRAAGGVLRLKFTLGLFEDPYTEQKWIDQRFHSKEHQDIALEAGRKSIILLKNQQNILPIKKDIKTIAVIGPNADVSRLGGYSVRKKKGVTVLQGIKNVAGPDVEVLYEKGVNLIDKGEAISSEFLLTPDGLTQGLKGEYFNNTKLEGKPVIVRTDKKVEFDWPWFPVEGIGDDFFSVRWTGYLIPKNSFDGWIGLSTDDGIRLWIDDQLFIDSWKKGAIIEKKSLHLDAGKKYKIRLETFEGQWGARAHLRWDYHKVDLNPAIEIAKKADVAIVVLGESRELVEENRDVASLDLKGNQMALIKAIQETGTPVVCVLLNGRPLSINWISKNVLAIVEAWFPGEAGGNAVADVLFGNYNPAGRLPITVPRSVGQLPFYYNQKPSTIHRYVSEKDTPLYPFGYGLSYTEFSYDNLKLGKKAIKKDGIVTVSVDVTNTGTKDGEEVVQLYINDIYSSVTTPLKTLKGFERVYIKKGETKKITFNLPAYELAIWNPKMERVVETGEFELMVGGNSQDLIKTEFSIIE